ncbi:MAG: hypothetical protein CVU11_16050, partial [Bacteroidetes bacterium HGW-Bacteroidetes-6]
NELMNTTEIIQSMNKSAEGKKHLSLYFLFTVMDTISAAGKQKRKAPFPSSALRMTFRFFVIYSLIEIFCQKVQTQFL